LRAIQSFNLYKLLSKQPSRNGKAQKELAEQGSCSQPAIAYKQLEQRWSVSPKPSRLHQPAQQCE
jgi:hypothetical protein